jgi:hypothetical protein
MSKAEIQHQPRFIDIPMVASVSCKVGGTAAQLPLSVAEAGC